MDNIPKLLIISGITLVITGVLWHLGLFKMISFGRLPGDIRIENQNTKFYFPITSCLVLSGFISLIGFLYNKFFK